MPTNERADALIVGADDDTRHAPPASATDGRATHLAAAQRIAQLGSWEWEPGTLQMSWSDELYRLFGYQPTSFSPTLDAFLGCIHPDDRLDVESRFAAALSTPSCLDFQYRIVRPDGGIRSLNCRAEVVTTEREGEVRIIGTAHDVTELRLFAGSLASQVEQFQQLTRASVAIYAADGVEEILEVATGEAMRIIGAEIARGSIVDEEGTGELNAHLCRDPAMRDQSANVLAAIRPIEGLIRVAAGTSDRRFDGLPNLGDEEWRFIRKGWLAVPLVDLVGGAGGAIQLVEKQQGDFTEGDEAIVTQIARITSLALQKSRLFDKLLESQQQLHQAQKMEAVGQLAGGIAHDFNNMLMAIQGFANLLDDEIIPGGQGRAHLAEIRKAADRSARLTRQLLAYGRRQVLQPEVLQLNDAIGSIEDMLRRLIGEHISFVTMLDPKLGHTYADPGQLEQVLMNLVVNARDAMPGGGRLIVRTRNHETKRETDYGEFKLPAGRYVALSVADTGCGIAADVLPRIYEPFFTTKPVGNGSGLGLATVYGIVKQSGGYIHVRSRPGDGTTFTLYLPRHDVEPALTEEPPRMGARADRVPATILIAEDESVLRSLAGIVLRRDGYRVLEAEDGMDALQVARENDYAIDLLVTDLVMPRLGGHRLAHQLLQHRPGLRIVFMSGYAEEAVAGEGLLGEGATFLEKPFSPKVLAGAVREKLAAEPGPEPLPPGLLPVP